MITIILMILGVFAIGGAIFILVEGQNGKVAVGLFVLAMIIFGAMMCVTSVGAGNVGVKDTFGNVDDNVFFPGLIVKNPFTNVVQMNIKTQKVNELYKPLTSEGLDVDVDLTMLYKLSPDAAANIYKTVGVNYEDMVIKPILRDSVRMIIADYEAKDVYTTEKREAIASEILYSLIPVYEERGVIVESILINDVNLPPKISDAIQQKLEAEQMISKKEFEVQTEMMEADRMRVEAQGIADAQAIIDDSLTDEYLRWYWITKMGERTGDTYYVPTGNDGLPLMATVNDEI